MSSFPKRSDSIWLLCNCNLTSYLMFFFFIPLRPIIHGRLNEWMKFSKEEWDNWNGSSFFQHSKKQVKIHGSPSSCLTCCLLTPGQVTRHTYFVEVQNTTAAANNRKEMRSPFYLSETSAAPDLKNEKAQRSMDDVTPWTWSTASVNLLLSVLRAKWFVTEA